MKVYLQRHCLTDLGPQMDADRGLDDIGWEQAKVMRKFLKHVDVKPDIIISSDFKRAFETAEVMRRKKTPHLTTPALRPDGTPEKAWKAIHKIIDRELGKPEEDENYTVLVVTHGPLIQPLLASVAFCFIDQTPFPYHHGAIAYVSTHTGRFRWYVEPKLAAHIIGEDPKEVESPTREAYAEATVRVAEHLLRAEKAALVDPLIAKMREAVAARFRRQWKAFRQAVKDGSPLQATSVRSSDRKFQDQYLRLTDRAYTSGAEFVQAELQSVEEAAKKKPTAVASLPGPTRTPADLENELDQTSDDQIATTAKSGFAKGLDTAAVLGLVGALFSDWQDERAGTIATNEVSKAYHQGGSDFAEDTGDDIEQQWESEPDACEICSGNSDQGYIDIDETFESGDDEPPAHPNCRCSISYRRATAATYL